MQNEDHWQINAISTTFENLLAGEHRSWPVIASEFLRLLKMLVLMLFNGITVLLQKKKCKLSWTPTSSPMNKLSNVWVKPETKMKPDCVNHRKAELPLRQVLGEALVVRILLQTQVGKIVANLLKKWIWIWLTNVDDSHFIFYRIV